MCYNRDDKICMNVERIERLKKVLACLKGYGRDSVLGPLLKFVEAFFELLVPIVVASMIDKGIGEGNRGYIVWCVVILAVLAAVGVFVSITAQRFSARAAVGCATNLRRELFRHLQSLSFTEVDELGTSTMITRMTSDINQIQTGVNMTLRLLLRSPFVVFGAVAMAFFVDVRAALVFVVTVPLLFVVVFLIMALTLPLYKKVQKKLDRVLGITRENLSGARVIRAFNNEDEEEEKFFENNAELTSLQKKVGRISAFLNPLTYVIINLAIVALIYVGAVRVNNGDLSNGEVVALYNYMSQILVELVKFASLIITLTKSIACAKRVEAVFDIKNSQQSAKSEGQDAGKRDVSVEFRNVGLTYKNAGAQTLEDISFSVSKGETLGIIGSSGSGKTSVIGLVPRFYDATVGEVLVDGKNVNNYDIEELRSKIAVVMQKTVLFSGTVRDNVRWGKKDATDEEIYEALEKAQVKNVIDEKGEGLDFVIMQEGKNLSGGQKQRISIARALVRKPEILILDDSSSALDYATDASLRKALKTLDKDMTVIVVSQRTSSIRYSDKILVLDDGIAVGFGTHDELLEACEVYREIHNSQYGGKDGGDNEKK